VATKRPWYSGAECGIEAPDSVNTMTRPVRTDVATTAAHSMTLSSTLRCRASQSMNRDSVWASGWLPNNPRSRKRERPNVSDV